MEGMGSFVKDSIGIAVYDVLVGKWCLSFYACFQINGLTQR